MRYFESKKEVLKFLESLLDIKLVEIDRKEMNKLIFQYPEISHFIHQIIHGNSIYRVKSIYAPSEKGRNNIPYLILIAGPPSEKEVEEIKKITEELLEYNYKIYEELKEKYNPNLVKEIGHYLRPKSLEDILLESELVLIDDLNKIEEEYKHEKYKAWILKLPEYVLISL